LQNGLDIIEFGLVGIERSLELGTERLHQDLRLGSYFFGKIFGQVGEATLEVVDFLEERDALIHKIADFGLIGNGEIVEGHWIPWVWKLLRTQCAKLVDQNAKYKYMMRQWINAISRIDESYVNVGSDLKLIFPGQNGKEIQAPLYDAKSEITAWANHYNYPEPVVKWFTITVFNWAKRIDPSKLNTNSPISFCSTMKDFLSDWVSEWAYGGSNEVEPDHKLFGKSPIAVGSPYWKSLPNYLMKRLPEWARTGYVLFPWGFEAYAENCAEYFIDGEQDALYELTCINWYNIADYLAAMVANGQNIERVSVSQAVTGSHAWHEAEAKNVSNDVDGEDIKTVMDFKDGYRMVQILSTKGLDRESAKLAHCVGKGGYDAALISGSTIFYSLRNNDNDAFATLEVHGKEILQAKGRRNEAVAQEVHAHVAKFIVAAGLHMSRDHKNIGIEPIG
jgi:hypothetical protein